MTTIPEPRQVEIDPSATLSQIVDQFPQTLSVLRAAGLDLCCGGSHSLAEAARLHGLDLSALMRDLQAAA